MATQDAAEYLTANVGLDLVLSTAAADYLTANVGLAIVQTAAAAETISGEALDGGAAPVIFALVPNAARGGEGITVIGSGFGATQAERAGVVETFNGTSWEALSINSWARISANADAGTATRVINPATGECDPEHEQVEVGVPSWATPPSLQIRVRTTV